MKSYRVAVIYVMLYQTSTTSVKWVCGMARPDIFVHEVDQTKLELILADISTSSENSISFTISLYMKLLWSIYLIFWSSVLYSKHVSDQSFSFSLERY